ncbi:MAG TPA: response regulator transcription factor [Dehalococcoidales bacterium]|nr:response regulator transcription factor [Dehalococcoidales bacterium]
MMEKIKIFVVDNNSIFREGLRRSFDSVEDFDLLGDTNIDEEALELVMTFAPEIVLLDIGMPLLAGLDLARQITQKSPGISIVVLDTFADDEHLFQAVKSGAAGYLTKNVTPDELASTIRRLYQGENVISEKVLTRPKVAERVLKQFQDLSLMGVAMEALTVPLTPRELEVLSYVARGYINKAVAHKLCVSEQTVKNHMSSILHKLDANDRTQAVVLAMHYGWISLRVTKPSDSLIKD